LKYFLKFFIIALGFDLYFQYTILCKKATDLFVLRKGALMDPKLVRQFITVMVLLFGWTILILLAGLK